MYLNGIWLGVDEQTPKHTHLKKTRLCVLDINHFRFNCQHDWEGRL